MSSNASWSGGAGMSLSYPGSSWTAYPPDSILSALRDESSKLNEVSRACLQLCQYSGSISTTFASDVEYWSCPILSPGQLQIEVSSAVSVLSRCCLDHTDRRCRILAVRCLASFSLSGYGRLRSPVPRLECYLSPDVATIENQIATDAIQTLCSCALDDPDDGVASAAVESAALFLCDSHSDPLLAEIRPIISFSPIQHELPRDHSHIFTELRHRVVVNILHPKLQQLIHRVAAFPNIQHRLRCLPLLSTAVSHLLAHSTKHQKYQSDAIPLAELLLSKLLIPQIKDRFTDAQTHPFAIAALRILQASPIPTHKYRHEVCLPSSLLFAHSNQADDVQHQAYNLALTLFSLRGLFDNQAMYTLSIILEQLCILPKYLARHPFRIGLLTEVAILIFNSEEDVMQDLIQGEVVTEIIGYKDRKNVKKSKKGIKRLHKHKLVSKSVDDMAQELVVSFCYIAYLMSHNSIQHHPLKEEQHWLKCSINVLHACAPCVNWKIPKSDTAPPPAAEFFLILLLHTLSQTQMISPSLPQMILMVISTNVSFEYHSPSSSSTRSSPTDDNTSTTTKELTSLLDQILEYKLREEITHSSIRIGLLTILANHWVMRKPHIEDQNHLLHEMNAREILSMIGTEISKLLDSTTSTPTTTTRRNLDLLALCIHSIEDMALSSWQRGTTTHENNDDSSYIVSISLAALNGHNHTIDSSSSTTNAGNNDSSYLEKMIRECELSAKKIQSVMNGTSESSEPLSVPTWIYSRNVYTREDSRSDTSVVVPTKEQFEQQLFWQKARLIIQSRAEQAPRFVPPHPTRSRPLHPQTPLQTSSSPQRRQLAYPSESTTTTWRNDISCNLTGSSDPISALLGYTVKSLPRYDGSSSDRRVVLLIKLYNITAVPIPNGLKLNLYTVTSSQQNQTIDDDSNTFTTNHHLENGNDGITTSATAAGIYNHEIKPGQSIDWEVVLTPWHPSPHELTLSLDITFRDIQIESTCHRHVNVIKHVTTLATMTTANTTQETSKEDGTTLDDEQMMEDPEESCVDVTLSCQRVSIPNMVMMSPCPLVFFGMEEGGDEVAFRFLWWNGTPCRLPELNLSVVRGKRSFDERGDGSGSAARILVNQSSLVLNGENDGRDAKTKKKGWSLVNWYGKRIMCILTEVLCDENREKKGVLEIRGDDADLIIAFVGTVNARKLFLMDFMGGEWVVDEEDSRVEDIFCSWHGKETKGPN